MKALRHIAPLHLAVKFPRPVHALKNVLVLPGCALAWVLSADMQQAIDPAVALLRVALVLVACCLVAGWNYALNDFCDRDFDRWHPEKSSRSGGDLASVRSLLVSALLLLGATGLVVLGRLPLSLVAVLAIFVLSGLVYNVAPIRLKRFPFVDVLTEAFNFPLRLALGWYSVWPDGPLPPMSSILVMWAFGGLLLTGKRAAELARIGDVETARAYRPALLYYTRDNATVICSVYGLGMLFQAGVLFQSYQVLHNLMMLLPLVFGATAFYIWRLSDTSLAAMELEPDKLLRRKSVWSAGLVLGLLAGLLVWLPVDLLAWFGAFLC